MARRLSFEEFDARVQKAYNGRISVVKETYVDTRHPVTAYCNVHKIYFEVKEARFLTGKSNCPECSIQNQHNKHIKPWIDVYTKMYNKYGDKFSYDESTYNGTKEEMKVHCNDCGTDFEITPEHHLKYNNGGCPICHLTRVIKCAKCRKDIIVDRHVSLEIKMLCDECKKEIEQIIKENDHKDNKYKECELKDKKLQKIYHKVSKTNLTRCPFCGQMYTKGEKCKNELCNQFQSIKNLKKLIPFGFDYSSVGTIRYIEEFKKVIDLLFFEYFVNKCSPRQIYEKYNCKEYFNSEGTLRYFLKVKLNYKTRNLSEAQHNAIETGVLNIESHSFQFNTEYHTSWEGKTFLLRSSYESEYANMLDEQHITYEVEKLKIHYYDTQEQKERISIPDFYLPETNTIVEIKSIFTLDVKNMKDRIAAYIAAGYNFKLILEHKECDINEIVQSKNNDQYKAITNKYRIRSKTKVGHNQKFHWMHNNIERIQVALIDVEYYQSLGWILGALTPQKQKENIANGVQPCAVLPNIQDVPKHIE